MTHIDYKKVNEYEQSIKQLSLLDKDFLENLSCDRKRIKVKGDHFSVVVLGNEVSSEAKEVIVDDKLYMQYRLVSGYKDEVIEVAKIYLGTGGYIYSQPDHFESPDDRLGDYDDFKVVSQIYNLIATGVVNSKIFAID